jgi:hypothetical protein
MRERDKYSQKINFKYKIFFKISSTYKITVTPGGGGGLILKKIGESSISTLRTWTW